MELVDHHLRDLRSAALPEGDVGKDLCRAADDGSVGVHCRVAGDHADLVGPEDVAEGEELLADEGLDRCRVVGPAAGGHGRQVVPRLLDGRERLTLRYAWITPTGSLSLSKRETWVTIGRLGSRP